MSDDRTLRNALAALLLVAALFVAMNQVVASAPFADWWLPLVLFIVGAALVFAPSLSRKSSDEDEEAAPQASSVHTYLVAAPQAPQLLSASSAEAPAEAEVLPFADSPPQAESDEDDLTRINGIGRKSADALKAAGIDTFQKLATTNEDTLRAAISAAGVRLVGNVDTWAQQAAYAARGDWDGLKQFIAERKSSDGD